MRGEEGRTQGNKKKYCLCRMAFQSVSENNIMIFNVFIIMTTRQDSPIKKRSTLKPKNWKYINKMISSNWKRWNLIFGFEF